MSMQSQKKNMKTIHGLVSQNLGYIFGERESGPNGAKKQFHTKTASFLRAFGRDLGFQECKVTNNYGGIAVSGEITLMGMWREWAVFATISICYGLAVLFIPADFPYERLYRREEPVASNRAVCLRKICGTDGYTAGIAETVKGGGRVCSMMKKTAGSITPL